MPDQRQTVGVREVAARAGVSRQTVSRVVNNHPSLRPETREKVLKAIEELGYRPNRAARALGTNRSRTIGVVASNSFCNYGPDRAIQAICSAAEEHDYHVHISYLASSEREKIIDALNLQLDMMVDGIVIIAPQTRVLRVIDELGLELPYVLLQGRSKADPHALHYDQLLGGRVATRHLLKLGHRVIAHVAGPQEWIEADARMQGYLEELSDWDVDPMPPILGDWTAQSGYQVGQVLAGKKEVTAVFAANDALALGVIHALYEAGVKVPEEVSVIGFDDVPEAKHFWPPLTTIAQDFTYLGRRAVAQLLSDVDPESEVGIAPQLVVRVSTAPAPK